MCRLSPCILLVRLDITASPLLIDYISRSLGVMIHQTLTLMDVSLVLKPYARLPGEVRIALSFVRVTPMSVSFRLSRSLLDR